MLKRSQGEGCICGRKMLPGASMTPACAACVASCAESPMPGASGVQNVFNLTMRDAPDMTGAEIVREFTEEIDWLVNK